MLILLGSPNRNVMKRWQGLLYEKSRFEKASTLRELTARCKDGKFDLVLLHRLLVDPRAFSELRKQSPLTKFFLLSDQPGPEEGLAFLKLGIVGYGNTYISPARLTEAVRVITGGGVWLGQKIIQHLIQETYHRVKETVSEHESEEKISGLTKTERKIAELVAKGQSNLEIAADLDITERTVKAHLTSVYEKTGTGNRLNLALLINRLR